MTRRGTCRAFTLTEVLVVLAIAVILLGIALPALRAMGESQERSSSASRLGTGIAAARDAAVLAGDGADVAAVFTYDVGGTIRIVACKKVADLPVATGMAGPGTPTGRLTFEIFVPIDTIEPVSLPRGWTVRAYATPEMMTGGVWYTDTNTRYTAGQHAWVFPETDFYNHSIVNDGANRQTFMVRFQGGSGKLVGSTTTWALVMLPRPSDAGRTVANDLRANLTDNTEALVSRIVSDPRIDEATRQSLLGPNCGDMVLTRAVQTLALADEERLAADLGARVDDRSGCLYAVSPGDVAAGMTLSPVFVNGASGALSSEQILRAIESYADPAGTGPARKATQDVRLYTIDRYAGTLQAMPVSVN